MAEFRLNPVLISSFVTDTFFWHEKIDFKGPVFGIPETFKYEREFDDPKIRWFGFFQSLLMRENKMKIFLKNSRMSI